ncbi:hypothetical protein AWRIB419_470 [Oenococcus oeni AWRIB419]|nr:hypothetical protein AWRIB304_1548 [Oenococcus oeni AWRIB304]EJN99086.1 hypothetical protein AWRIB318_1646 [Oenococcus oeni AWRIB318]EJO01462.1 hypothetical protein AWRIB419_470 [Oenococcus oeni AWRIB419]EJO04060.1 hypothetical protein AWRIB553_1787 [Oenococcus oeni AWRIB553]EJO07873.1 hypothetical protein AWRIB548_320 [Oenococcus oeni AWRIB548]EJO09280.1 hypothetical protein AWRIB576_1781 [Oenococcus oeni AWRIB576]EJO09952.1 hypothetical protein AWRIB568_1450 [Oenococcus oeni AWRIB568]EK
MLEFYRIIKKRHSQWFREITDDAVQVVTGIEPVITVLQTIALPLGYTTKKVTYKIIAKRKRKR